MYSAWQKEHVAEIFFLLLFVKKSIFLLVENAA
jgi:hypothetical protein